MKSVTTQIQNIQEHDSKSHECNVILDIHCHSLEQGEGSIIGLIRHNEIRDWTLSVFHVGRKGLQPTFSTDTTSAYVLLSQLTHLL